MVDLTFREGFFKKALKGLKLKTLNSRKESCLYQFNNTSESYPRARNMYSIVCLFGWW